MKITTPFRHPLATHPAGTVLGFRTDGRPIYAIAGGNGEGEGAPAGAPPAGDQGTAPTAPSAAPPAASAPRGDETDWKAEARKWEQRAKENKTAAEEGKTAAEELAKLREQSMTEQEKAVAAAEKAGRTAAAQEAAAETERLTAQIREMNIRESVRTRAGANGAKPDTLLNSISFRDRISGLDPSAKTFSANLDDAIKAELKDHPEAAATGAPSGPDLSGGTREKSAKRGGSLSGAIRDHYQT